MTLFQTVLVVLAAVAFLGIVGAILWLAWVIARTP